ncbi:hypothetical protein AMTR_s02650p00005770 [Amborella trichopoda]|uniref:Uncharacterized protein n=1 Tax=Amborella trichopoda TaxID=13333 RepID=U5CUQ7_AMBTC|nr:hypothetical protein AMTR_s02650p00005770 [Amborella trichopoda]
MDSSVKRKKSDFSRFPHIGCDKRVHFSKTYRSEVSTFLIEKVSDSSTIKCEAWNIRDIADEVHAQSRNLPFLHEIRKVCQWYQQAVIGIIKRSWNEYVALKDKDND